MPSCALQGIQVSRGGASSARSVASARHGRGGRSGGEEARRMEVLALPQCALDSVKVNKRANFQYKRARSKSRFTASASEKLSRELEIPL